MRTGLWKLSIEVLIDFHPGIAGARLDRVVSLWFGLPDRIYE
jgi:hypothetical protein